MRSLTEQDEAVLNAQDGYSVHARVWVWDGAAWVDVTSLEGRNWLVELDWDKSINEPCAQAHVQLRRQLEDYSLNPLVSNKLTGTLALARPFYIQAATVPLGDAPTSGDWREVFRGQVESLAMDKDPITFTGRDNAGVLLRASYIETETEYGSDSGVAVETVLQSILTDNGTGVTLYVPTATGAVFSRFKQKRAPVLTAIRELALRIGWDVRYLWDDGTSTFRFTLIKPDRAGAAGSQWTFSPARVKSVTRLEQSLNDIRNAVKLYYYNRAVLDADGKPTLASVTSTDATSISTYGRQYMQLAEDEDSPIDSASEAQAMADAARDDLKDPLLDFGVAVGFHYGIQLGDLLTFEGDDRHFSADQTLAVVSAAHRIGRQGHRTTLKLRGKPVGAHDAWMAREGRIRKQQPATSQPDAPTGLVATATINGATITFTQPSVFPPPAEYELHLSASSGFTPDTSSASTTLYASGTTNTFTVTDLDPGTTWYAKVLPKSSVGVYGTASAQVSFTTLPVQPRHMQERIAFGSLPPNGDFEAQSDSLAPPDAWGMNSGTWGTDVTMTSDAATGTNAVLIAANTNPQLDSQWMVVRPSTDYTVQVLAKRTGTAVPMVLTIRFYSDLAGTLVGSSSLTSASPGGAYEPVTHIATSPSSARYALIRLSSATGGGPLFIDSVEMTRSSLQQREWLLVGAGADSYDVAYENGWTTYGGAFGQVGFRINSLGNVEFKGMAFSSTPAPAGYANVFTLPSGYRPAETKLVRVNVPGTGASDLEFHQNGTVKLQAIVAGTYLSFDGLSFPLT